MCHKFVTIIFCSLLLLLASCNSGSSSIGNTQTQGANSTMNAHNLTNIPYSNTNGNPYLLQPNGAYSVGTKDYHFINNSFCPDVNYVMDHNESYFSPGNESYCHEIMARVYYPSNDPFTTDYSLMYRPLINSLQEEARSFGINESKIQQLAYLTSYTRENLNIANSKFPVIFFISGYSEQGQRYENIITNLVSNGYIIVVINSVFISGDIQLPNGVIVPHYYPESNFEYDVYQRQLPEEISDLKVMYAQILTLHNQDSIFQNMDLDHIGAIGHSLGGLSVISVANSYPWLFDAVSTLDEACGIGESYIANKCNSHISNPALYQYSAQHYLTFMESYNIKPHPLESDSSYQLLITTSLKDVNYTWHQNFADDSTMQYQPALAQVESIEPDLGTGDGFSIARSVNQYLSLFFNFYLQNSGTGYNPFTMCRSLTFNTILSCRQNY